MSKSESTEHDIFLFDNWLVDAFRRSGGFTALIVLMKIDSWTVSPLRSTFVHVVGADLDWVGLCSLLAGAGVAWDGVLFETLSAEGGGPVEDVSARDALRVLERRVVENRLIINEGHFFDKWGRRLKIEEALPQ